METTEDIVEIQNSAELLQRALKIKLEDNLHELAAVQEMLENYNVYNTEFSTRIFDYLKSKYETQVRGSNGAEEEKHVHSLLFS
jgi:hypothetical protein